MGLHDERADQPPVGDAGRPGVIDIGSNSIRLVVYDGLVRAPTAIFNEKIMCGLGRTVGKTGRLDPQGVDLALDNLVRFRRLAAGMAVGRLDLLATAAVRDAEDGPDFVAAVKHRTGFDIRVLSGEEEARLSAMGVLSGTPGADGIMGDLGGGSMEMVGLDRGAIGPQVTLPLGPLRLMENAGQRDAAVRLVDDYLGGLGWLSGYRGRTFYPVGGSWRALAKAHMEHVRHPLHIIHHYVVDATELAEFSALIARQSKSSLEKMSGVSRRRADAFPYAALVMERLIRAAQPRRVVFSAYGLREGHMFDLLTPEERQQDPLLCACAVVADRMRRFGAGQVMASWTASLFAIEDEASARLRRAACLLSDLGWAEHPDYRAEHAYMRVLRMPFVGVDHAERAFLALVAYVRYGGRSDASTTAGARQLLDPEQIDRARVVGQTLRLAHTLSGGVAELLRGTSLYLDGDSVVLSLPEDGAMLSGDVVQRRLSAVAKALNRTAKVLRQGHVPPLDQTPSAVI